MNDTPLPLPKVVSVTSPLQQTDVFYLITSQWFNQKYAPIVPHWIKNTKDKCKTARIYIPPIPKFLPFPQNEVRRINETTISWSPSGEAFWDVLRLGSNIHLLRQTNLPIVHCDLDVIAMRDLQPIVDFGKNENIDIIFSRETWGAPVDICSGFYILFPPMNPTISQQKTQYLDEWLNMMKTKKYGTYSDQNTLRLDILESGSGSEISTFESSVEGNTYHHTLISHRGLRVCILDMNMLTRDPMTQTIQFANHINVDNVGGTQTFIRYFYEPLDKLPLTCRCGKSHLGNNEICRHTR